MNTSTAASPNVIRNKTHNQFFMSETTAHLIPLKSFEKGEFIKIIKATFENLKFIDGYYNVENSWFAAGENAHLLFSAAIPPDENPPFEFVEIHDTEFSRLIPEGLQEPAECPKCGAEISEYVNDLLFSISEMEFKEKRETDIGSSELTCPNCSRKSKLSTLSYHEKIAFSNQFVCFMEVLDDIDSDKLIELEKEIGTSFGIIYGSI